MMDKDSIIQGLIRLNDLAKEEGISVEIMIHGGAAMVLAHGNREITHDIDAVFIGQKDKLRKIILKVASENGWDDDWINDAVSGFISENGEYEEYNIGDNFSVHLATPEYLFAMKAMAMRFDESGHDKEDIIYLLEKCEIRDLDDALSIIEEFYPSKLINPKTQFGLEMILDEINNKPTGPK